MATSLRVAGDDLGHEATGVGRIDKQGGIPIEEGAFDVADARTAIDQVEHELSCSSPLGETWNEGWPCAADDIRRLATHAGERRVPQTVEPATQVACTGTGRVRPELDHPLHQKLVQGEINIWTREDHDRSIPPGALANGEDCVAPRRSVQDLSGACCQRGGLIQMGVDETSRQCRGWRACSLDREVDGEAEVTVVLARRHCRDRPAWREQAIGLDPPGMTAVPCDFLRGAVFKPDGRVPQNAVW